jgi:hypothetical protein
LKYKKVRLCSHALPDEQHLGASGAFHPIFTTFFKKTIARHLRVSFGCILVVLSLILVISKLQAC